MQEQRVHAPKTKALLDGRKNDKAAGKLVAAVEQNLGSSSRP